MQTLDFLNANHPHNWTKVYDGLSYEAARLLYAYHLAHLANKVDVLLAELTVEQIDELLAAVFLFYEAHGLILEAISR